MGLIHSIEINSIEPYSGFYSLKRFMWPTHSLAMVALHLARMRKSFTICPLMYAKPNTHTQSALQRLHEINTLEHLIEHFE